LVAVLSSKHQVPSVVSVVQPNKTKLKLNPNQCLAAVDLVRVPSSRELAQACSAAALALLHLLDLHSSVEPSSNPSSREVAHSSVVKLSKLVPVVAYLAVHRISSNKSRLVSSDLPQLPPQAVSLDSVPRSPSQPLAVVAYSAHKTNSNRNPLASLARLQALAVACSAVVKPPRARALARRSSGVKTSNSRPVA
jgi:hypothetical protein